MIAKMILFDIDGTLLMTGGAGKIAIERAFYEVTGLLNSWRDIVPDGKTDPVIFDEISSRLLRRPLTGEEQEEIGQRYRTHFLTEIRQAANFRLLPGVRHLLETLSNREDVFIGVATGNFEETAWGKLGRGGIETFFRFGGFGSDSSDRVKLTRAAIDRGKRLTGNLIETNAIYVVGDSLQDIRTGKKLEVRTVAVATGSTSGEVLSYERPDYLLSDLSDSDAFLKIIGEG